jgi:hypothetical protein
MLLSSDLNPFLSKLYHAKTLHVKEVKHLVTATLEAGGETQCAEVLQFCGAAVNK